MSGLGRQRRASLWSILTVFAIVAALPFTLFAIWTSKRLSDGAVHSAIDRSDLTARSVAHALDRELSGLMSIVKAMTLSPALKQRQFSLFDSYMREVYASLGIHLVLRDTTGQQILSTRLPYGWPLPVSQTGFDERTLTEAKPYVTGLVHGVVSKSPLFLVVAPVMEGERIAYLLNLSLPAEQIGEIVKQTVHDSEHLISVIGPDGKFIHTSTDSERLIGQEAAPSLLKAIREQKEGRWYGPGFQEDNSVSFAPVGATGWTVAAAVPARVLEQPWRAEVSRLTAAGVVALAASLLLAYLLGRNIVSGLNALVQSAHALHAGRHFEARPHIWISEFQTLDHTLRDASDKIETARDAQQTLLREMRHRIRNILAVVISICRMSYRNSTELRPFYEDLSGRLEALANTSEIITERGDASADFGEIIDRELRPFRSAQLTIRGQDVRVSAEQATYLALMLHELGTNALKHGALRDEQGQVDIAWRLDGDEIVFDWRETPSMPCAPLQREGFGSTLLRRVIPLQLRADVRMTVEPNGFTYSARFPQAWKDPRPREALQPEQKRA